MSEFEVELENLVQEPDIQEPTLPKRGKVPLTCRTWAKVTAFILAIVMVCTCGLSVLAAVVMVHEEMYITPRQQYLDNAMENLAHSDAHSIALYTLLHDEDKVAEEIVKYGNLAAAKVQFRGSAAPAWSYNKDEKAPEDWDDPYVPYGDAGRIYTTSFYWWQGPDSENHLTLWYEDNGVLIQNVDVTLYFGDELTEQDNYWFAYNLISAMYYFRYSVYVIIAVSAILTIACFIFLMCASGRHPDHEGIRPGWGTKIPVDALTFGVGFLVCMVCALMQEATWSDNVTLVVVWSIGIILLLTMALGWCMSFALRLKLGQWWKNSLCWWCLVLCWKLCRWCWKATVSCCRGIWRGVTGLVTGIPTVWKIVVGFAALAVVEFLFIAIYHWNGEWILIWWCVEKCLLFPAVVAVALMLRKLEQGGKALAQGDLNYQVDTKGMLPVLRRHGENLNCISGGMTRAVEERTKSERMKTELITNVSHDIKTPLTSIINYADLIGKEPCDNEKITEYAGVLHRQSERLKRLIDDLVEASKASTGNLEVVLSPCELGVMLTQTAGEYEQKLAQRKLTLVTRQPEEPVRILADGRRLWRVFDNLMNNVYKYGQSGTRVYLTLEEQEGQAVISVKNTSHAPLNLTAEELTERFVRGDASRSSEGNGLGLSIARSLVHLQNGVMDVSVDGDLFKVVLKFPILR